MAQNYAEVEHSISNQQCLRHPDKRLVVQFDRAAEAYIPWCVECYRENNGDGRPALGKEDYSAEREWKMQTQEMTRYQGQPVLAKLQKDDIRKWIAPKASDQELEIFLRFCVAQELNPFAKDVYLIPFKNGKTGLLEHAIVVGLQAYLKKASRNPQYQTYQSGVVVRRGAAYLDLVGTLTYPGDVLFGAWCKVWKKGSPVPFEHRVALADWDKGSNLWASHKNVMIEVTAVRQTIRRAFPSEFGPIEEGTVVEGMAVEVVDAEAIRDLTPLRSGQPTEAKATTCPVPEHNGVPLILNRYKNQMGHIVDGQTGPKGGKVWCFGVALTPPVSGNGDQAIPSEPATEALENQQGGLSEAAGVAQPQTVPSREFDTVTAMWGALEEAGYTPSQVGVAVGTLGAHMQAGGTRGGYFDKAIAKLKEAHGGE